MLVPVLQDFNVMSSPCHMAAAECWLSFCSHFGAPLAGHVVVSGFCVEFLFHCARVYGVVVSLVVLGHKLPCMLQEAS